MSLRAKHLASDVRRAVTVEAVIELAAEQNPSEITTAAIAERMNVTQGALFRHFVNKEAVWTAVMEVTGQLLVKVDRADKGIESPLAALEAVFLTHIDFIAKRPEYREFSFVSFNVMATRRPSNWCGLSSNVTVNGCAQ